MTKEFKLTRRNLMAGLGIAGAALGVGGLTGAPSRAFATDAKEPRTGGTLILYWEAGGTIDPHIKRDFGRPLVDSLIYQDPDTLAFHPWLAKSWEVNDAGTEFTFHLRDDVTFSNGERFDGNAVKANFDYIVKTLVPIGKSVYTRGVLDKYLETVVLDDFTVKVRFSAGTIPFLAYASTPALAFISPGTLNNTLEQRGVGEFAGSGPFVLESYRPGVGLSFVARKDYNWAPPVREHNGRPYLDRVDIRFVNEVSVREDSVLSGQAHVAFRPSPDGETKFTDNGGFFLAGRSQPGLARAIYPSWNRPLPAETAVRRAFLKAIDRQEIESLASGTSRPAAKSPLSRVQFGFVDLSGDLLKHDPDGANAILDEAGWTRGADGIRQRDGNRLELSLASYNVQEARDILQVVQAQVKRAGIALKLVFDDNYSVDWDAGKFDFGYWGTTAADSDVIRGTFQESNGKRSPVEISNNFGLEPILQAQLGESNPEKRKALLAQAQRGVLENALHIPLVDSALVYGVSDTVKGFIQSNTSEHDFYDTWLNT